MKTLFRLFFSSLAALALTGCDLIDYHPYDTHAGGEHGLNAKHVARIEEDMAGRDSLRFAVISDTQRWYDEANAAVRCINARGDVDFVVHCGDISDFGVTKEMELQRDIFQKFRMPYVVLLGNHDCLGTGADTFRWLFGPPDFSFTAGDTHFLCLNTNAFEYDYSTAIPDFSFIKNDRTSLPATVRRTVVVMHAMPGSEQFNNNVAEVFEAEIGKFPGLQFCLCGHGHHTGVHSPYSESLLYYECGSAKTREFLLFTLKKDGGYSYETVSF